MVVHVVVHVVVMMVMVMVMMVMHRVGHGGGGLGRRRFLCDGVTGEADGESGGGDKALDHGKAFLLLKH